METVYLIIIQYGYLAATGVVLAGLAQEAWRMAFVDDLTGLPGRRALGHAMAELGNQYAIAMLDVDHFKKFNDTYGHDVGDIVLKKVARELARVGGERVPAPDVEQAVVLGDADGLALGDADGDADGLRDGLFDGDADGLRDGLFDGDSDGLALGDAVGNTHPAHVTRQFSATCSSVTSMRHSAEWSAL